MDQTTMVTFFAGAIAMGQLTIAGFFLRFWARTREPLFAVFAVAFVLLSLNQALPVLLQIPSEDQGGVFLFRLLAFGLIIVAVVFQNLRRSRR